tara:strand:- start:609 stop:1178 length:570 start_codon:yes stop_codon:yes gene_type:complete
MSDKEIRTDAKLKNLPEEDLETLWGFRYPDPEDEDAQKLTYMQITSDELPRLFGFTVSLSTLSDFYAWYKQVRRVKAARARAEQAKVQLLEQNPDASLAELERIGQMVFTSETVADGNIKGFVALLKINKENRKLELDERRVKLLEAKAASADMAAEQMQKLKDGGTLLPEEERAAILAKVDEILNIKK